MDRSEVAAVRNFCKGLSALLNDHDAALKIQRDQANALIGKVGYKKPPVPFDLFLDTHENDVIAGSFSSWFRWGEINPKYGERGAAGAAHSVEAWGPDRTKWPDWTHKYDKDDIIIRPNGLDAALLGVKLPKIKPLRINRNMPFIIRGYPAGLTVGDGYTIRFGSAYMDRPEDLRKGDAPSWIVTLEDGSVLVMGGMSGGVVTGLVGDRPDAVQTTRGLETPLGILITQNTRFDHDANPNTRKRNSCDIVELLDVYEAVSELMVTHSRVSERLTT